MARIRSIKPDFWESEDTATLPMCAALTYAGLWNYSDDEGRGRFQPAILYSKLHGLRPDTSMPKVRSALDLLIERKLIVLYEAAGIGILYYIPSFKKHQHPDKPQPSKYPTPPLPVGERLGSVPVIEPERSPLGEEGRKERSMDRKGEGTPSPLVREPTDDDIVAAVHSRNPNIPDHKIRSETTRAGRLGVSKARLLKDIESMGERLLIWTIVDLYQPQKTRNGNGGQRENATAYSKTDRAPVLDERREDVQKRQDDARAKCDAILEAMEPDQHDGWTRDAEAAADKAGANGGPARMMFVKSFLRSKVAKEHGIEGL